MPPPSTASPPAPPKVEPTPSIPRYTPSEEATHLARSTQLKDSGNSLFAISNYDGALSTYEQALAALPTYLDYEMAVLRSNVAACCVKLEEWKRCVEECDKGVESLENTEKEMQSSAEEGRVQEIEDEDDGDGSGREDVGVARKVYSGEDVARIKTKLLLRRAKAKSEMGGWAELQGALEGEF
jgi:tetratricopeptide (TPR) repeat protein